MTMMGFRLSKFVRTRRHVNTRGPTAGNEIERRCPVGTPGGATN